ncbi:endo-1,4-beta-xylanase [Peribacillus sp. B2I2]|uniref:endo-1,4-beta-xylanase n=1 Tax=Peribacillus sp. B2I2 TaxID=3156468 RepID=UPI0035146B4C
MKFKNKSIIKLVFLLLIISMLYFIVNKNSNKSLRVLAEKQDILIGTSIASLPFLKDKEYRSVISREFNVVTIENDLKFARVHPQKETYNFLIPDLMVEYGIENNISIRGHTLVWHNQIPDWITQVQYSKDELKSILKSHIQTVVKRYKGKIYAWDVVNEAIDNDGNLRRNIWMNVIGPEYIELAFRWAHEADPNAQLYYNDYGNESINSKSDATYKLMKKLKANGVPIDGVGFQFHTSINTKHNYTEIKNNFSRFNKLGLKTEITELDVKVQNSPLSMERKLEEQAKVYSNLLEVCLKAEKCNTFITWGVTDKYTWIPMYTGNEDYPLLFTDDYKKKPSYDVIYNKLQND